MEKEELHETAESATQAIEKYLKMNEIEEENAIINLQLDYCKEAPDTYSIEYTVWNSEDSRFFTPKYTFKDSSEARKAYQDHVASIETGFEDIDQRIMDPSLFTDAGKYGGNILI